MSDRRNRPHLREELARGKWAEDLFREAADRIARAANRPYWLVYIGGASKEDDHEGTDGWAYTDKGPIPIQVKTSLHGAEVHKIKRPEWEGMILVFLDRHLTADDVAKVLLKELERYRERVQILGLPA